MLLQLDFAMPESHATSARVLPESDLRRATESRLEDAWRALCRYADTTIHLQHLQVYYLLTLETRARVSKLSNASTGRPVTLAWRTRIMDNGLDGCMESGE